MNTILVHGLEQEITKAYRQGALAMRHHRSWNANPYPENTKEHADWASGYENEEAEEHLRFGIDVIRYDGPMRRFEADPDVVRNTSGYVF